MREWIEPIYDRTQYDVEFAISKIAEWVSMSAMGTPVFAHELKGCLNVSDINRIESNVEYLATALKSYRYSSSTSSKTWVMSSIPTERDVLRIINNVGNLNTSFITSRKISPLPSEMNSYEDVNAIERNLNLIKELIDAMVGSFKKANTFKSGSSLFLPLRRESDEALKVVAIINDVLVVNSSGSGANIIDDALQANGSDHAEIVDDVLVLT